MTTPLTSIYSAIETQERVDLAEDSGTHDWSVHLAPMWMLSGPD